MFILNVRFVFASETREKYVLGGFLRAQGME